MFGLLNRKDLEVPLEIYRFDFIWSALGMQSFLHMCGTDDGLPKYRSASLLILGVGSCLLTERSLHGLLSLEQAPLAKMERTTFPVQVGATFQL